MFPSLRRAPASSAGTSPASANQTKKKKKPAKSAGRQHLSFFFFPRERRELKRRGKKKEREGRTLNLEPLLSLFPLLELLGAQGLGRRRPGYIHAQ
jgi:hypothetical protein